MKLPVILSSTFLIATAILGINNSVYAQCRGGWCPIPNAYFDQNAPSQYGYNSPNNPNPSNQGSQNPNWQGNPYWQGNQNPNWQGNQSPDLRNDNGARANGYQSYNQGSNNAYYRNSNLSSNSNNQGQNTYFHNDPNYGYYYHNLSNDQPTAVDANAGPDKLIQHKIEEALKNNYLKKNYSFVNARVYNGNVTLSGSVESEQDRQDVENRIKDIEGVRDINDQLKIGLPSQMSYNDNTLMIDGIPSYLADNSAVVTDADLQKQVDDTLKNNYVKKNFDTVVATVSNGVVTVSGPVNSDKDRQEILERLRKIKGITNVNDRLQVTEMKTSFNNKKPAYAR